MSFPTSPSNGQSAVVNNITYTYSTSTNSWKRATSTVSPSNSITYNGSYLGTATVFNFSTGTTATVAGGIVTIQALGAVQSIIAGTDTSVSASTGNVTVWDISTLQSVTGRGATTPSAINITNTTAASSTTTGALIVAGGVGVGGNLNIGNSSTVSVTNGTITSARGVVQISGNSTGTVIAPNNSGVMLHVLGQPAQPGRVYIDGQGTSAYSAIVGRHYNGTTDAPSGLNANDEIFRLGGTPYHSTGWPSVTTVRASYMADETQTATALGSRIEFWYTPIGSATIVKGLQISSSGTIITSTSATNSSQTGALQVRGGVGVGGNLYVDGAVTAGALTVSGLTVNGIITATQLTIQYTTITTTLVQTDDIIQTLNTTQATSTTTGALVVAGGVGVGGNVYIGNSSTFNLTNPTLSTSRGTMEISGNADGSSTATNNSGVMLHITGATSQPGRIYVDGQGAGNYSAIIGRHYNGTTGAPTAMAANDIIFRVGATPYTSTPGFTSISSSRLDFLADEAQTSSAQGTRLEFWYTPVGSTTITKGLQISSSGTIITSTSATNSSQTGALQVRGGVGISGGLYVDGVSTISSITVTGITTVTNTTAATSTITGALTVAGGVGIGGALYVGGSITTAGTTGGISGAQYLYISGSTTANSTNTGALQVGGGAGIAGSVFVGGVVTATTFIGALTGTASTATSAATAYALANTGTTYVYRSTLADSATTATSAATAYALANTASTFVGLAALATTATNAAFAYSFNTGTLVTNAVNLLGGSVNATTGIFSGITTVTNTTAATSTSTGALQVRGGVGIAGTLYVGGLRADATTSATTWSVYYNTTTKELTTSTAATGGGGASVTIADTAPGSVAAGSLWWDSANANLRIYYNDGSTTQWVDASSGLVGPQGAQGPAGSISSSTTSTLFIDNITAASSTNTGALQVTGGVGIGGKLYVGNTVTVSSSILPAVSGTIDLGSATQKFRSLYVTSATIYIGDVVLSAVGNNLSIGGAQVLTTSSAAPVSSIFTITNTTNASSTTTGALQVAGGVGIGGDLYVGGTVTATNFILNGYQVSTGTINTSTLMSSAVTATYAATAYALSNTSSFLVGYADRSASATTATSAATAYSLANTASTYVYRSTLADSATTATSAATAYSTVAVHTAGTGLSGSTFNGSTAQTWTLNTATLMALSVSAQSATTATSAATAYALANTASTYVYRSTLADSATTATSAAFAYSFNTGTLVTNAVNLLGGSVNATTGIFSGITTVTNTTAAISTNSGALQVYGGVGIGGNLYAGNIYSNGSLVATGSASFNGGTVANATTFTNTVVISTTTNSNSTTTGALQVSGGIGVGGNIWGGGTIFVANMRADATSSSTTFAVYYNPATDELTTSTIVASGGGATLSATSVNSTFYVPLASSQAGSYTIAYNTSTFYFNPSSGTAYATIFQSLSDEAQKSNISIISNGLEIVENLRGVTFDWRNGTGSSAGLIAQDVEHWLPQLVSIDANGVKNLNYSGVIGALVEAVKTLSERVKVLESK